MMTRLELLNMIKHPQYHFPSRERLRVGRGEGKKTF